MNTNDTDEWLARIHAYANGELDAAARADLESRLEVDASLRRQYEELRDLRTALQGDAAGITVPEAARIAVFDALGLAPYPTPESFGTNAARAGNTMAALTTRIAVGLFVAHLFVALIFVLLHSPGGPNANNDPDAGVERSARLEDATMPKSNFARTDSLEGPDSKGLAVRDATTGSGVSAPVSPGVITIVRDGARDGATIQDPSAVGVSERPDNIIPGDEGEVGISTRGLVQDDAPVGRIADIISNAHAEQSMRAAKPDTGGKGSDAAATRDVYVQTIAPVVVTRSVEVQLRGLLAVSIPSNNVPSKESSIPRNLALGVSYSLAEGQRVGLEIGHESYAQQFGRLEDGGYARYRQNPAEYWLAASYELQLASAWSGNLPFFARVDAGGLLEVGPLLRLGLGTKIPLVARVRLLMAAEGSIVFYRFESALLTTKKLGGTAGLCISF